MNKNDYNNAMRLESYDLAKFAGQLYELNDRRIREAVAPQEFLMAEKVIATGCGDSYCAALAAKPVFEELVGIPAFGLPAIEVSRMFDARDFHRTLLFGISSRGKTSRVIEAAMRVNALDPGSKTVAIVNFTVENSQLEKECKKTIHVEMPVFECGEYTEHAPCQRSYFSTMFTLMLLAIRMGEVRGRYGADQAEAYRRSMIEYAEKFNKKLVDGIDDRMWELAQKWVGFREYEVVGSGRDYPSAWFGAAKVIEAFGDIATYEDTDNWMQVNRYAKNPGEIGTVVILDKDNETFDQTLEMIKTMKEIGRPVIVITDADRNLFPQGIEVFQIPSARYRWAKPLMQYSPLGNLLGYIARMRGASFYRAEGQDHYVRERTSQIGEPLSNDPLTLIR